MTYSKKYISFLSYAIFSLLVYAQIKVTITGDYYSDDWNAHLRVIRIFGSNFYNFLDYFSVFKAAGTNPLNPPLMYFVYSTIYTLFGHDGFYIWSGFFLICINVISYIYYKKTLNLVTKNDTLMFFLPLIVFLMPIVAATSIARNGDPWTLFFSVIEIYLYMKLSSKFNQLNKYSIIFYATILISIFFKYTFIVVPLSIFVIVIFSYLFSYNKYFLFHILMSLFILIIWIGYMKLAPSPLGGMGIKSKSSYSVQSANKVAIERVFLPSMDDLSLFKSPNIIKYLELIDEGKLFSYPSLVFYGSLTDFREKFLSRERKFGSSLVDGKVKIRNNFQSALMLIILPFYLYIIYLIIRTIIVEFISYKRRKKINYSLSLVTVPVILWTSAMALFFYLSNVAYINIVWHPRYLMPPIIFGGLLLAREIDQIIQSSNSFKANFIYGMFGFVVIGLELSILYIGN